jgi:hypothetical protein
MCKFTSKFSNDLISQLNNLGGKYDSNNVSTVSSGRQLLEKAGGMAVIGMNMSLLQDSELASCAGKLSRMKNSELNKTCCYAPHCVAFQRKPATHPARDSVSRDCRRSILLRKKTK